MRFFGSRSCIKHAYSIIIINQLEFVSYIKDLAGISFSYNLKLYQYKDNTKISFFNSKVLQILGLVKRYSTETLSFCNKNTNVEF